VDGLANPSLQRWLPIALAVVAALGAAAFVGVLLTAGRPLPARARAFRKRLGMAGLLVVVAAGAAFVVLRTPAESGTGVGPAAPAGGETTDGVPEGEVATARRFSSARLPAVSLDAPDGWRLEHDKAGRKLVAASDGARLLVSTAILNEIVDVQALLAKLAETQRTLDFDVGDTFSDRIGDLTAVGFLATSPARSVCVWMVKRDAHLASSLICTAEGKKRSARDACRAPLANLRWRPPAAAL
jgi:hypothetical protein